MPTPDELEIKYDCLSDLSPDDVEALSFGPYELDERTEHDLHDTILDTPSRAFSQRMVALRLRRDGDRRFLTLKGPKREEGQALRREELEEELLDGQEDDPTSWPEPVRSKVLEIGQGQPLNTLFEVRNRRIAWPVTVEGTRVAEIMLDRGKIDALGLSESFHEIEVELKEGEPADIEAIAERLVAALPLRHATRGKAERGFDLLARAVEGFSISEPSAEPEPKPADD